MEEIDGCYVCGNYRDPEMEHHAEQFECAMMKLDDLGVDRKCRNGRNLSIVGRIIRLSHGSRSMRTIIAMALLMTLFSGCQTNVKSKRKRLVTFICGVGITAYSDKDLELDTETKEKEDDRK